MAGTQREIQFCGMWDVVHLDEKSFNANKDCHKVYLVEGEEVEHRVAKSKRFVTKMMFLCAVARPREDFFGKVSIWPFVVQAPAARSSRNRPDGSMVTTLINVDTRTYHDYDINKVVPVIKATFPSVSKRIV
ncbi:hypothetical protein AaE_000961 [Aphanomyces astaci]|uniref:Uncharacterized protein n=1 Tax=Aphanomyces astaci TaxID=112090 RepID=A0A6A5AXT6_APHAT|nr:hypothetical protein AaE_000961 [Aphanomyces astaci]